MKTQLLVMVSALKASPRCDDYDKNVGDIRKTIAEAKAEPQEPKSVTH